MATTVVNRHSGEPYDVYIGRPSKWGNPYKISKASPREACIRRYRELVLSRPDLLTKVRTELRGKVLGCWCKPEPCHGDVLVELADQPD